MCTQHTISSTYVHIILYTCHAYVWAHQFYACPHHTHMSITCICTLHSSHTSLTGTYTSYSIPVSHISPTAASEQWPVSYLMVEHQNRLPLLPPFNIVQEVLLNEIGEKFKPEFYTLVRQKQLLLSDDMIIYLENPTKSSGKTLKNSKITE